jgi:hypothetical protein
MRWLAEADGEVEAFADEVSGGIAGEEFEGEIGGVFLLPPPVFDPTPGAPECWRRSMRCVRR